MRWTISAGAGAIVTTGDNAYPFSTAPNLEEAWAPAYGWSNGRLSVIATLGNHDVVVDRGKSTIGYFNLPGPWYSATMKNVDFFVLDANRPEDPSQEAWLTDALARSHNRWKVAVFHQPAFSCSMHDGDPRIVQRWVPLFQKYGVDLVLSGHDHNYQRFALDSTPYVVTGGAGSDLYKLDECPPDGPQRIAANDQLHHFLGIQASATQMNVEAIDADGKVFDSFSIKG
jgi:predicted MPP superfamily phosphohydrolase